MKRLTIFIVCALCACASFAQTYRSQADKPSHWLTLSAAVGESNTFSHQGENTDVPVSDMAGMFAQIGIGSELAHKRLFYGMNVQLDFAHTRQMADYHEDIRSGYLDRSLGVDGSQAEVGYHYIYDYCREIQSHLNLCLQLYMGGNIGEHFYALGGVRLSSMAYGDHKVSVKMATRKVYSDIVLPEVEEPSDADGNYDMHMLSTDHREAYGWITEQDKGINANPLRLKLAPVLELGYRFSLRADELPKQMRIGVFAEWGIPLLKTDSRDVPLVDYSRIESRKSASGLILMPDNRDQLDSQLRLNSLLTSEYVSHASAFSLTHLMVGVRFTMLLRTSSSSSSCHCLK